MLWNISLARYWASVIRISVTVKDSGVILEVLPGVAFLPIRSDGWLIKLSDYAVHETRECFYSILLKLHCVVELPREVSYVQECC